MRKKKYSKQRFYKKLMYQKMGEIEKAFALARSLFAIYTHKPRQLVGIKEGEYIVGENVGFRRKYNDLKILINRDGVIEDRKVN